MMVCPGTGTPPLGFRGTIVGVHDDACEVLFDREFPGGTDLFGRQVSPPFMVPRVSEGIHHKCRAQLLALQSASLLILA
jgi:hypothetical protein